MFRDEFLRMMMEKEDAFLDREIFHVVPFITVIEVRLDATYSFVIVMFIASFISILVNHPLFVFLVLVVDGLWSLLFFLVSFDFCMMGVMVST